SAPPAAPAPDTLSLHAALPISTNYLAADSAAVTITIGKATPTVTVTWADPQTFNGNPHPASAAVTGVGSPAAALGPADAFTYYLGSSVSGSGSSTAPTNVGTYTVLAHFNTTTNYVAAASAALTMTIDQATPTVTV